jgi:hypothetical protein
VAPVNRRLLRTTTVKELLEALGIYDIACERDDIPPFA